MWHANDKNPSDAAVRRIMKENDVVQSAIQLANSGGKDSASPLFSRPRSRFLFTSGKDSTRANARALVVSRRGVV